MSPGLCRVGCRLVSMRSPSRRCRYTILPLPLLTLPPPPPTIALPLPAAADLESSCFATASRFCSGRERGCQNQFMCCSKIYVEGFQIFHCSVLQFYSPMINITWVWNLSPNPRPRPHVPDPSHPRGASLDPRALRGLCTPTVGVWYYVQKA